MIISRPILLRMRNTSHKSCREMQNIYFMFNNFLLENRAFYEITWKNAVGPGRPHTTKWRMWFACWIPKATNTYTEYAIRLATMVALTHLNVTLDLYVHCLYYSLVHTVQTGSTADPAPYSMRSGSISWDVKRPGLEADHSLLMPRLRMNGATPLLPLSLHGVYRENVIFTLKITSRIFYFILKKWYLADFKSHHHHHHHLLFHLSIY